MPGVSPIPGTTKVRNLLSNVRSAAITLTEAERVALSSAFDAQEGERGPRPYMAGTYRKVRTARL